MLTLVIVGGVVLALGATLVFLQRQSRRGAGPSALGPFLRHFEREGVPPEVAAAVFHQLQGWMRAQDRAFAVRPQQDLVSVYGLVPEEVHAAVGRLARTCGLRADAPAGDAKLVSVSDLVREVARRPPAEHA